MIFFNIQFGVGAVLVDTVPLGSINKDYFEKGKSA
jgi:hypothetical protein